MHFSRRGFLKLATASGVALGTRAFLPTSALASPNDAKLLLMCYFSGGWDQLLVFDPRPTNVPEFSGDTPYTPGGSGILPAYGSVDKPWMDAALAATGGSGVQKAGNLTFGPAVPAELMAHHADLCIVRGIDMGTLAHEVGRRHFLTGRPPRGIAATGSSLDTLVAELAGKDATLPNLAIGQMESYNDGNAPYASAVKVVNPAGIRSLLKPLGTPLGPGAAAVDAFVAASDCRDDELDVAGQRAAYLEARDKAHDVMSSDVDKLFAFNVQDPGANAELFDTLGLTSGADVLGPKGGAAIAAQALRSGVTRAVGLLTAGLDDCHDRWAIDHPQQLRDGLLLLGNLIKYLKSVPYMDTDTSTWEHTTLVVFSEFARTPLVNGAGGRDHHLSSSCLVAGPGIKGNRVIGATSDVNMTLRPIDLATGAPEEGGVAIRPGDIHETLLASMGFHDVYLGNQAPRLIDAMLKA